jgi:hypothetical protein
MIIFYEFISGNIIGSISGKRHFKEESNFWIGDKNKVNRLIYTDTAPYYEEIAKDPLFSKKYKINLETLFLEPTRVL